MLVVSWNVNSLNARMPRVTEFLAAHQPDALCLQETKCGDANFPHLEVQAAGYTAIDHGSGGRDGVAILVRDGLDVGEVRRGLHGEPRPQEARWVEAEIEGVRIVSTYVINGRSLDDPIFADKLTMLERIRDRVADCAEMGPLCVVGDFNIAPRDEDVWDLAEFHGGTHISPMERKLLDEITAAGVVDAWDVTPERGEHEYTWWDYRAGNFHKNKGLRIDFGLITPDLVERLEHVGIDRDFRKGTKPSDHAPLMFRFSD